VENCVAPDCSPQYQRVGYRARIGQLQVWVVEPCLPPDLRKLGSKVSAIGVAD
jgi:hypothetical protein